ncbi:MAG: Gfo/Idh/MocA family oxidoreductase [Thermoguttaceae bacterium]
MVSVGIVGVGFMGMIHYLAYQRLRGVKVRAICEQDPVRRGGDWRTIKGNFGPPGEQMDLSGVAQYADLDAMLADPELDLIDICLPTALHAPAAIKALAAGKHVLCEKPIALKPADGIAMVDAADKAGRMLMIGHVLPLYPEYRFAYEAIASGTYGQIKGGHFKRIISDPLWMPRFYDPAVIGGPMLDLHVHDAHFIRLTCGMPRTVQCAGSMRGEVVERFHAQFRFEDPDLIVTAASGVIAQQGRPFTHGYEIYLEKATLLYDFAVIGGKPMLATPLTVLTDDGQVVHPELCGGDAITPFENELTEVVNAVQSGVPSPLLGGALARDAVVICQKETEAVLTGETVRF